MNAVTDRFEDRLEPLAVATGVFLVLAAVGTLVGQPWATNADSLAVALQIVGTLLMAALGAGLAWLGYTGS